MGLCDIGRGSHQSKVRRERMGHINWQLLLLTSGFSRCAQPGLASFLDMSLKQLEKILYFEAYVVLDTGNTNLKERELLTEERYRECVEGVWGQFF